MVEMMIIVDMMNQCLIGKQLAQENQRHVQINSRFP